MEVSDGGEGRVGRGMKRRDGGVGCRAELGGGMEVRHGGE